MKWFFDLIDRLTERTVRQVAHNHGRRSLITRLGVALVGGAALPMLPFDRSGLLGVGTAQPRAPSQTKSEPRDDPTKCEYWRYCAFDGYLCTCCGGNITSCPPGTEASKVSGSAPA